MADDHQLNVHRALDDEAKEAPQPQARRMGVQCPDPKDVENGLVADSLRLLQAELARISPVCSEE